jgi:hypothetical protein
MPESLEERVARLEALHEIAALKARYARLADAKYTPAHQRVAAEEWERIARRQAECFAEDACWYGGPEFGGTLNGRAALAGWFARSPWRFAMHYYVAPDVTLVAPENAEGSWRLWQLAIPLDADSPVLLAGVTRESYRRVDGAWLVVSMRFESIHTVDLSGAPAELRCVLPGADAQ